MTESHEDASGSDPVQSGPTLEANRFDWVNSNLGGPPDRVHRAAQAAADAITSGDGLNAAMAAATSQWIEGGHGDKPFWEMNFWAIWMQRHGWFFAFFAVVAQLFWLAPLGWIAVLALTPLPLGATVWHFYVAYRLSSHGLVAPGVLVDVTVKDSEGDVYVGTYEWQFHGPHLITQVGSTPRDVLVLFDPAYPKDAVVINRLLSLQ